MTYRVISVAALIWLMFPAWSQAQSLRVIPADGTPYTESMAAQAIPEFLLGTPLRLIWDYPDTSIPQATSFQVQIDSNPAVPAGAPTLGVNTYQHNLASNQLTLGNRVIAVMACNEEGCNPASITIRIRRAIPPPPGNPRVSPQQQAFMTQPIPFNRAIEVAKSYADLAYNIQVSPAQIGVLAQFHPPTTPTTWSVIQAIDLAVETFYPAPVQ